ncbi:O(6)-methylguanine-induced apoptosis 2 [Batrachochytrium dendrobatidis]|nr:O(6)-methylguanine-induced apoptosis 2 [Batrachochytrium dendrobatidis]
MTSIVPRGLFNEPKTKTVKHSSNVGQTKNLKISVHPPSIPTKFQTLHYDDSEERAFNSTSQRFEQRIDDLPGPGYYAEAAEKLEGVFDVSTSKRGYGIGFASHSRRFAKLPIDSKSTLDISPAQYRPRTPIYSFSVAHSLSSSFHTPTSKLVSDNGRSADVSSQFVRTQWAIKPTPGPGEYTPSIMKKGRKHYGQHESGAVSVFKSRTTRSDLIGDKSSSVRQVPPPGSYNIVRAEGLTQKSCAAAQAAFKATSRQSLVSHHGKIPGPGAYEIVPTKPNFKPSLRRGRAGTIALAPVRPHTPLSSQTAVPGSGMTPVAFPGPGHYNIAQCTNNLYPSGPILQSNFVSKAPRFADAFQSNIPGPGFYHPIGDIKSRSFHLNMNNQWS